VGGIGLSGGGAEDALALGQAQAELGGLMRQRLVEERGAFAEFFDGTGQGGIVFQFALEGGALARREFIEEIGGDAGIVFDRFHGCFPWRRPRRVRTAVWMMNPMLLSLRPVTWRISL